MTLTNTRPRTDSEPVPNLVDYRVVHRAMTLDVDRLAAVAESLVTAPDGARLELLRWYLAGITAEIDNHHTVEDVDVWPHIVAVAGQHAELVALTDDHHRLDPLLHRAGTLAALPHSTPELVSVLRELSDLLVRHIADEERDVFPLITRFVRVEDYRQLQERFRSNISPRMLPFLAPWVVGHATPAERRAIVAEAGPPMRILLAVCEPRFRRRARKLFG